MHRKILGTVIALSVLAAGAVLAQQHYTDPGLQPTGPYPVFNGFQTVGPLTFYPDRGTFQAAHPGLPLEDFSGTSVPPGGITACDPPLSSATNDACFSSGSVIPGFSMDVTVDGGGGQYVVVNATLGLNCVAVGPNSFVDETDWDFSPAVAAVGVDLYTPVGGGETYNIEIFGAGGSQGSTAIVAGGTAPAFIGVSTADPNGINRIEVREAVDSTAELFCDLEFGEMPIPVEVTGFSVE